MTKTIELDQVTAQALEAQAQSRGISLGEYLRLLAEAAAAAPGNGQLEPAEFERALDELSAALPALAPLAPDFSRTDIYADRD